MPEFAIDSVDDARLDPYRDLKRPAVPDPETFIAEGEKLVLRILDSPCRVESILCTPALRDRFRKRLPADVPIFVAATPVISCLIGFQFHRGILACGLRPASPRLASLCDAAARQERSLILGCPEIRDPANLGVIIRTAAAFGVVGVISGRAGTDPFSRRALRTSMGAVLRLPIVQTDDWETALETLHSAGFDSFAAVVDPAAEPLASVSPSLRTVLLLGNEDAGIRGDLVRLCKRRVTLPMAASVDSLNVAVATGIILHHFANAAR